MKVLVTGASGQLGTDICLELKKRNIDYYGTTSNKMNVTDIRSVNECLTDYSPDIVIHCAAYTKVDLAEDEAEKCWKVNVEGTQNIAKFCASHNISMMYISTDYVFPGIGQNYYEVGDPAGPHNVYGASKLAGEFVVSSILDKFYIVRVSWVFGKNGNNFVKTMLKLSEHHREIAIVEDQIGSPTYTEDLAKLLCDIIATEKYGVYHATNEGICSWAEFAEFIFKYSKKDILVRHIKSSSYASKALRPLNSRLSKRSLDKAGFKRLPQWQDALYRYLKSEGKICE